MKWTAKIYFCGAFLPYVEYPKNGGGDGAQHTQHVCASCAEVVAEDVTSTETFVYMT